MIPVARYGSERRESMMRWHAWSRQRLWVWLLLLLLAGCQSVPGVAERVAAARELARAAGMTPITTRSAIPLQGFAKLGTSGAPLVIYIEGDGNAWLNRRTPSPDPTPANPVALQLAVTDPTENVVYLARPGQYRVDGIDQRYWLSARFSAEVVDSYLQAIHALIGETRASAVHLAGFSGGGAIAALVAVRLRAEDAERLVSLRTVGGNLDVAAWAKLRRLTPLAGSLNPADFAGQLGTVPQRHFSGRQDRQVPRAVLDSFLARLPDRRCVQVVDVDAGHAGPWRDAWLAASTPPHCDAEGNR